jgi:glycosyltransferase 2 family protein
LDATLKRRFWLVVQLLIGVLVFWYVARALVGAWWAYHDRAFEVQVVWSRVVGSGVVFLATYAVLIETWRAVVRQWGEQMRYLDAAHIWTVASLTRYLPLKLWQIPVMARMAREVHVSPVAAAGSAIIGTLVNIGAGFLIALTLAPTLLERARPGAAKVGLVLVGLAVAGLLALPWLVPRLERVVNRLIGRQTELGALPMRAIALALAGNLIAWLMYGYAFRLLASGIIGETPGLLTDWVAAWAISYVIGYIFLFLPAGVGARESVLLSVLPAAGLAGPAEAAVLMVVSRLWLTILEIVPGLVFLASGALRRRAQHRPSNRSP